MPPFCEGGIHLVKHHYLPQFYLRGFTDSYPKKKGRLFEFDLVENQQRGPCLPKEVAFAIDFYKADDPRNDDPNEMEDFWNYEFENKAAPVFHSVFKSQTLPEGEDLAHLLLFIASLAVRVPVIKNVTEGIANHAFRDSLLARTKTPQLLEELLSESPISVPSEIRERVRADLRHRLTTGRMANEVFLANSLSSMKFVIEFLFERAVCLRICEDGAPNLVCPDWPVRFVPSAATFDSRDYKLRLRDSLLVFRLNKRMVLFVAAPGPQFHGTLTREESLAINRMAVLSCYSAHRYVYSADQDFALMGDGGCEWHVDDLREHLRRRRKAAPEAPGM